MNGRTQGWARDRYLRVTGNYPGGGWGGSGGSGGGWGGSGGSGGGWGGSGGSGSGQYGYLTGARPARAEDVLRDRGFRIVDTSNSGRTYYSVWFSRRTRECVRMTVANDRVQSVNDIRSHPRCR
jgi:hypothetical protein